MWGGGSGRFKIENNLNTISCETWFCRLAWERVWGSELSLKGKVEKKEEKHCEIVIEIHIGILAEDTTLATYLFHNFI